MILKLSLDAAVAQNKDMENCPTPDCDFAFVKDGPDFECPTCKQTYCIDCKSPLHKGMSCKEYLVNNKDDSELIAKMKNEMGMK